MMDRIHLSSKDIILKHLLGKIEPSYFNTKWARLFC